MRWLTVAVILYLAATLLSTILSASFDVSMWGEVPGEDGYAAYTIIAYVVLFGVIATHLRTRPQLWRLLGAIVAMGVLFAVYALVQQYGDYPLDLRFPPNVERATSTVGNPILAGAVLLMTIPISVTLALVTLGGSIRSIGFWCKATAWALVLTVQFMGILFTESRGPWAGTLAALVRLPGTCNHFCGMARLSQDDPVIGNSWGSHPGSFACAISTR